MNLHFFKGLSVLSASQRVSNNPIPAERNVPKHARYTENIGTATNQPLVVVSEPVQRAGASDGVGVSYVTTVVRTSVRVGVGRVYPKESAPAGFADFAAARRFTPLPYVEEQVSDGPAIVHVPRIGKALIRGVFRRREGEFIQDAERHYNRMERRRAFLETYGYAKPTQRKSRIEGEQRVAAAIAATGRKQVVRFLSDACELYTQRGIHNVRGGAPASGAMKAELAALQEATKRQFKESKPWVDVATKPLGQRSIFKAMDTTPAQVKQLAGACVAERCNSNVPAMCVDGNPNFLSLGTPNTCGPDAVATLYFKGKPVNAGDVAAINVSYGKNKLKNGMTCMYGLALIASRIRMPTLIVGERALVFASVEGADKDDTVLAVILHSSVARNVLGRASSPTDHWYTFGYVYKGDVEEHCGKKWQDLSFETMCACVNQEKQDSIAEEKRAQLAARAQERGSVWEGRTPPSEVGAKRDADVTRKGDGGIGPSVDVKAENVGDKRSEGKHSHELKEDRGEITTAADFAYDQAVYAEVVEWVNTFARRSRGLALRTVASQVERSTSQVDNGPIVTPSCSDSKSADLKIPAPSIASPDVPLERLIAPVRKPTFGENTTHNITPPSTDSSSAGPSDDDDEFGGFEELFGEQSVDAFGNSKVIPLDKGPAVVPSPKSVKAPVAKAKPIVIPKAPKMLIDDDSDWSHVPITGPPVTRAALRVWRGRVTTSGPVPKIISSHREVETYAATFDLARKLEDGTVPPTQEVTGTLERVAAWGFYKHDLKHGGGMYVPTCLRTELGPARECVKPKWTGRLSTTSGKPAGKALGLERAVVVTKRAEMYSNSALTVAMRERLEAARAAGPTELPPVSFANFTGKGNEGGARDEEELRCPCCGDPTGTDKCVVRTGFRPYDRRVNVLERIFGTAGYVCYECARVLDNRRHRRRINYIGGTTDPFPLLCAPSTMAQGFLIVPRLEEASYGRIGTPPFAMGETVRDGQRYCWYNTSSVQRNTISPRGMIGWHLAFEAGIFQVYVNTPVATVTGSPFPADVTGIVTYKGIVGHHTVYIENTVLTPFVLSLQSQPPTMEGFGISNNSQFRAVTAALGAVNWLSLHPQLAVEAASSLPGSVLAHIYTRLSPAPWNIRTSIFKFKLFLGSGRLFSIVEEFGCQAVLSFAWGLFAAGLGIPFTKAFSDAFSGMVASTLDAPAWLKILVAISCGPYGFIMCLCTSFLSWSPVVRMLVGALVTTVVVVAIPYVSIPALVATLFAKWAAASMGMMAVGALYTAGKFLWDNRLYVSRKNRKSFGVTLYPVQPYGTTVIQNQVGGSRDDGCVKAKCTHDLTPIERTVGHIERGYKVHMFVDLKPEISDHYSSADASFSDAVQMRLTKKRANPVQMTATGAQHSKSTMPRTEWQRRKRAADKASLYLDKTCDAGRAAWDRRFAEFDVRYGRGLLDHVLHPDFPLTKLNRGSYKLNPLFYQWWAHLDSSKKRIYENEVRRLEAAEDSSPPLPSSVSAKANVKIEIMPFLTKSKTLKPRIIQYMPPEFMVHVAPQCWAYGDCMKASTGENVCITSGYSVDEYSDLINEKLRSLHGRKRAWFMVANGDDNGMITNWVDDADSARLYQNVVDGYQFHARDVTCHVKRTIIDGAYCSSTFLPVMTPEGLYYRHYMLPFKQAYKAFTFVLSREHQYIAREKVGAEEFGRRILKAAGDASVSRYFMFRGDPFMEPVMLAMLKRCGRAYVANWSGRQAKAWFDKHLEHSFGWTAGLRVYERNEIDDALIWDAHEYRTGIARASLIALRDELVSLIENNGAQDLRRLANAATFVEGLSVEQGLKTLSGFRKRPDWIGHGDCLFVESDNGSYDASTTMHTHRRMIAMQRSVAGESTFVSYNNVREQCRVRLQCERGFGSWTIVGQMMSGWPDTTISNSFSNIWEMLTALELHGGF